MFERNRTRPFLIRYALYLYYLGLSLNTSKALEPLVDIEVMLQYGIEYRNSIQNMYIQTKERKTRITAFIIDSYTDPFY
jgi:hypothetical protein